ncbi:MAG: exodeoxyribonuclease III [Bacilli bacterium]|jgi:exodeoxyribonuclease-3|nr:exodeoxyribonuclease III [Bacilli bacterium]MCH4236155.1 exodeoxyribonuclease III [Bacilli bacterium]
MKLISWNTNGLRAAINKGFIEFFNQEKADAFCIQETKMQPEQLEIDFPGYYLYMNSADKKGYSGTAIITKKKPLNVTYGIHGEYNDEGRIITAEFEDFYLMTSYTPNSQEELRRLPYRMTFEDKLREYLIELDRIKPVILCGDLNVAHQEIDLKNPKANHFNPGFSDEEREKFSLLLKSGFVDSFRFLYPETIRYSWWSYRFHAREKGIGWRIDYFVVSEKIKDKIVDALILDEVEGSDHCPVVLNIAI